MRRNLSFLKLAKSDTVRPIRLLETYPETVVHVRDVLVRSQVSAAFQSLFQLLDLYLWQTEVSYVGPKINLRLVIFGPSR